MLKDVGGMIKQNVYKKSSDYFFKQALLSSYSGKGWTSPRNCFFPPVVNERFAEREKDEGCWDGELI